jgi:hypothetical protein
MGRAHFPVPTNLADLVRLAGWDISIHRQDEHIYILTGDQVAFSAESEQEAFAFLYGIFLQKYSGQSLNEIDQLSSTGHNSE